jgi:ubiquinone/menaquinone biosynthesis C-methylase UbiE
MAYNAQQEWTKDILCENEMSYPSEYVIRIFKGNYPRLSLNKNFQGKTVCEVGCGDGRNLVLLKRCGLGISGTELTEEILDRVRSNLRGAGIQEVDLRVGTNARIPFPDNSFDYLLSWNACYYMGQEPDFEGHVREYARVLKPRGFLVLSIPKESCFIYKGCEPYRDRYVIIRKDPFDIRNGEIFRIFSGEEEIEEAFSPYFDSFVFGSVHDDCFGFEYHWHLLICQKRA